MALDIVKPSSSYKGEQPSQSSGYKKDNLPIEVLQSLRNHDINGYLTVARTTPHVLGRYYGYHQDAQMIKRLDKRARILEARFQGANQDKISRSVTYARKDAEKYHQHLLSTDAPEEKKELSKALLDTMRRLDGMFSEEEVTAGDFASELFEATLPGRTLEVYGDETSARVQRNLLGPILEQYFTNMRQYASGRAPLRLAITNGDGRIHVTSENPGDLQYDDPMSIYEKGVSQKPRGGTGLYVVDSFVKHHGGEVMKPEVKDGMVILEVAIPKTDPGYKSLPPEKQ